MEELGDAPVAMYTYYYKKDQQELTSETVMDKTLSPSPSRLLV